MGRLLQLVNLRLPREASCSSRQVPCRVQPTFMRSPYFPRGFGMARQSARQAAISGAGPQRMTTAEILEWYATISGVVAAIMLAGDFGRRVTGFGFILFCTMNIAWITFAQMDDTGGLMWQNILLFFVNLLGVWQYLLSPKNRRKMRAVKQAVQEFEAKEAERPA